MHSVRIEDTELILVGTRITYQASGDAGYMDGFYMMHIRHMVDETVVDVIHGTWCLIHNDNIRHVIHNAS